MSSRIPQRLTWAVEQLRPDTAGTILEVGCGAGHALGLLRERFPRARLIGIDRSAGQVTRARAQHAAGIAAGHVRIEHLDLLYAPAALNAGPVATVLAVNVNAFWTRPGPSLTSVAQLLAASGRVYLVFEAPSAERHRGLRAALPPLLEATGFRVEDVRKARFARGDGLCIVGVWPGRSTT